MTVTAVIPTADASSPSHPDHDRWVKESTLAMEVAHHCGVLDQPFSVAESENIRLLERMEARAREAPLVDPTPSAPRQSREERAAERGVTVRPAQPLSLVKQLSPSPCGRCGSCRHCKAEGRLVAVMHKAKLGDQELIALFGPFAMLALNARARLGQFRGMRKADIDRIVTMAIEVLCDRTVPSMGNWR